MLLTSRCTLQAPSTADVSALVVLMTAPDVRRYLGGPVPQARAADRAARLVEGRHPTTWTVHLRRSPVTGCVGLVQIGLHHDGVAAGVSYSFLPKVWGSGIATEAVRAVVSHALDVLGEPRLVAETQAANSASRRLLERVGMRHERDLERVGAMQAIYAKGGLPPDWSSRVPVR